MTGKIKSWVGRRGKQKKRGNLKEDVKVVTKLLNEQIRKWEVLKDVSPLDGSIDPLVEAIQRFQSDVLLMRKPDGRVDPKGLTFDILKKSRKMNFPEVLMVSLREMSEKPVGDISPNVWRSAMRSLCYHYSCLKLYKPYLVTIVDFTKPSNEKRMWIVDIKKRKLLLGSPFHVGHGKGGGKMQSGKRAPKNTSDSIPKNFSNQTGSYLSSLGAFVTLNICKKPLGKFSDNKDRITLKIDGLDGSVNNRAFNRGIYFHAASYVKPKENPKHVGCSHGCFVTQERINEKIIPVIKNGSFVYAYGPGVKKISDQYIAEVQPFAKWLMAQK